jgi:uncharacterized membrane protein
MVWHPALVHFPIAFLTAAWLAETLRMHPRIGLYAVNWEFLSRIMLIAAVPSLALAMISGSLAEGGIEEGMGQDAHQAAHDGLERHELLGYLNGALATLLALWRSVRSKAMNMQEHRVYWGAFTVVMVLLTLGSWMGGQLVYEYGLGVRHSP